MSFFLQFVWLVVFTFGAPAFTVLALFYWRQGRNSAMVFRVFTALCAISFMASLVSAVVFLDYPVVLAARTLLASLLPPMMAHLVFEQESKSLRRSFWKGLLRCLYAVAAISALGRYSALSEIFDSASPIVLGAAALFSLAVLLTSRERARAERRYRVWNLAIFTALLLAAVTIFISDSPFLGLAPDYLLLAFFAVRLYYTERLAFFDMFLKGGAYFAAGVVLLALVLILPPFRSASASDWLPGWLGILTLTPVWLGGPLLYHLLGRWMDRVLDRRYSPVQAERLFMQAAQASNTEQQLHDVAVAQLQEIFHCPVEVRFKDALAPSVSGDLACAIVPTGHVHLLARESQIPFLSADRRLLETLATNLGLLLQNVRLRAEQQERLRREQELASLASRAELRALRAQINPHFLFNALNAIAGWIRTEPEFADDTLAQLAEVFRYTLHRSQQEWVRVGEEVEFIRSYLAVEQARFGKRLNTEIALDPVANDVRVPVMLIQPLIENAIKHGVSRLPTEGRVSLAIGCDAGTLHIEVVDNGPGFPLGFVLDGANGHGLRSVADRLRGYYGEAGALQWENTAMGCRITIRVPDWGRP